MPVEWKIDPVAQTMDATCLGVVSLDEMLTMFDAIVVEEALPYSKLFDMREASSHLTINDMHMIGARVQAYSRNMKERMGLLAIVASSLRHHVRRVATSTLSYVRFGS